MITKLDIKSVIVDVDRFDRGMGISDNNRLFRKMYKMLKEISQSGIQERLE